MTKLTTNETTMVSDIIRYAESVENGAQLYRNVQEETVVVMLDAFQWDRFIGAVRTFWHYKEDAKEARRYATMNTGRKWYDPEQ